MHDPLSQTSFYLETSYQGNPMELGTCFFVQRNSKTFLVTNWHVVTSRNPITKEFRTKAVEPDLLTVKIHKKSEFIELVDFDVQLKNEDGVNLWLEHPHFSNDVDIAVIEVKIPDDCQVLCVEQFIEPFNEKTTVYIKDDVYVIGFPFGLRAGNVFPIWKRGSIASEPVMDIDNLPKMYIDTASRPGMSGSPIIYKERRPMGITDGDPNLATTKVGNNFMQFVGIYSGRLGDKREDMAQLGIAWKFSAVEETISQTYKKE